ncbi:MAG: 2-amino-4-hydroxy-6-hydroxymethyldihydropteridine diphosphokinase [Treponema sp.]|jgi:2-amino-4-hydroxy-6-hydroxymethyldihydropteridine diphosphokinase|nr:2-amino-4-hydroxy-6-hydroxymethyldihydropteridine diphosphokinase [Treponema sp.]
METAYIALGSNLGDREAYLSQALERLDGQEGIRLEQVSAVYQTDPVGYTEQAPFLNLVCRAAVSLDPFGLLETLQAIERALDRKRDIRWGPRTIDLDILLYGDETIQSASLVIPHQRMFERAFVLIPLRDVYPPRPLRGKPLAERIAACSGGEGVAPYRPAGALAAL